jgi:hypothetical protein
MKKAFDVVLEGARQDLEKQAKTIFDNAMRKVVSQANKYAAANVTLGEIKVSYRGLWALMQDKDFADQYNNDGTFMNCRIVQETKE